MRFPRITLFKPIATTVALATLGLFATQASADAITTPDPTDPVTFIYNCTISGAAPGTNICDQGPEIAQVTIATTATPGVLSLSILRLFPPTNDPSDANDKDIDLVMQALHLNFVGDISALPTDSKDQDKPKPNDPNVLQFSKNILFDPKTLITVEDNASTALNYKGFDLQLCDTGVGECGVDVTINDTIFGYIRSGNEYVLNPQMFNALTEDAANKNSPDRARTFDGCDVTLTHLYSAIKIVEATSPQDNRCSNSGNANGYGPYYGALGPSGAIDPDPPQVPVPGTLLLLGLGLAGLGFSRKARHAA